MRNISPHQVHRSRSPIQIRSNVPQHLGHNYSNQQLTNPNNAFHDVRNHGMINGSYSPQR